MSVHSITDRLPAAPLDGRGQQFDGGGGKGDDDGMETRIAALEAANLETRDRLARIETRLESTATKADVVSLESSLLKWFIATAIALTGLAFAAAKLIH